MYENRQWNTILQLNFLFKLIVQIPRAKNILRKFANQEKFRFLTELTKTPAEQGKSWNLTFIFRKLQHLLAGGISWHLFYMININLIHYYFINDTIYDVVLVARLEAFRALKLSRLDSFRALKSIRSLDLLSLKKKIIWTGVHGYWGYIYTH